MCNFSADNDDIQFPFYPVTVTSVFLCAKFCFFLEKIARTDLFLLSKVTFFVKKVKFITDAVKYFLDKKARSRKVVQKKKENNKIFQAAISQILLFAKFGSLAVALAAAEYLETSYWHSG